MTRCLYISKFFREIIPERFPQALENLEKLISDISYDLDTSLKLPRFNPAKPAVEELRERAELGLAQKGLSSKEYQERLDQELAVIHDGALMIISWLSGICCVLDVRMAIIWVWDGVLQLVAWFPMP